MAQIQDWGAGREFSNTASDHPRDSEIFGHYCENLILYHRLEKHTAAPPIPTAHTEFRNKGHVLYYTGGQVHEFFCSATIDTKKLRIRDRVRYKYTTHQLLLLSVDKINRESTKKEKLKS